MSKLTDTQLVFLAAAAARPNKAVLPPPETVTLSKSALTKVINSLLLGGLIAESPAERGEPVWREDGDQALSLSITAVGLEAIGVETGQPQPVLDSQAPPIADKPTPRRGTGKVDAVLTLLRRPEGASIAEMNAVTEWQAHSIRAFLSGLRKQGTEITRTKDEAGKAIYRIDSKSPATEQAS
ncbi:MAG: DUF3489 domain-containing protein [Sphingomonadales bacterium]